MQKREALGSWSARILLKSSGCSIQVWPVAALGLTTWSEVVAAIELYLGQDLLLHAAVSSASVSMVTLILDLHDLFQ